ncbi:hypothetical protein LTR94_028535, partial [Friedmanniomyces endolithicus]
MRSLVRTSLQQLGVREIREAADGEVALRDLVAKPVHLIISDFNMPNLDGLGLLRAVRAHPPTAKTAFIMLTGRADRELVQRAVQFGVNNYLVKPFTVAQLKGKMEAEGQERRLHVGQGEHRVTDDPHVVLSTILGSCVSMCLRDPVARVGGMNHFLLPEASSADVGAEASRRYGAYAMELLINEVLKAGGRRDRLEAKLFGGGRMFDGLRDVGRANADFAERFLRDEGIQL